MEFPIIEVFRPAYCSKHLIGHQTMAYFTNSRNYVCHNT